MASLVLTYTLANGTTADASEVQTNFNDGVTYTNARNSGAADWDIVSSAGLITGKAEIRSSDGTVSAPAYSFTSDTDTGFIRQGTGAVRYISNGSNTVELASTGIWMEVDKIIYSANGTNLLPSISFVSDANTGVYRRTTDSVSMAAGGSQMMYFGPTANVSIVDLVSDGATQSLGDATNFWLRIFAGAGTSAAASITFGDDPDTGVYSEAADKIGFAAGGSRRFVVGAAENATYADIVAGIASSYNLGSGTLPFGRIYMGAGLVGTPAYTFGGDTNTGIYWVSADNFGFSTNGVERLRITNTEVQPAVRVLGAAGAVDAPAYSFSGDPDTGIYNSAADTIAFAAGGLVCGSFNNTAVAAHTRLSVYDVDNATVEAVTVGIADSGGAGFKVLKIPN